MLYKESKVYVFLRAPQTPPQPPCHRPWVLCHGGVIPGGFWGAEPSHPLLSHPLSRFQAANTLHSVETTIPELMTRLRPDKSRQGQIKGWSSCRGKAPTICLVQGNQTVTGREGEEHSREPFSVWQDLHTCEKW